MNTITDPFDDDSGDCDSFEPVSAESAWTEPCLDASQTRSLLAVLREHGVLYQSLKLTDRSGRDLLPTGVALSLRVWNPMTGKWLRVMDRTGRKECSLLDWYDFIRNGLRYEEVVLVDFETRLY